MSAINKIRNNKYHSLPEGLKLLCKWYQWIMWDAAKTRNTQTFKEYFYFRHFMLETIESLGIKDCMPKVNENNYLKVWFEVENKFHKQTLLDMTHEFYEIKDMHRYFMMVEIK